MLTMGFFFILPLLPRLEPMTYQTRIQHATVELSHPLDNLETEKKKNPNKLEMIPILIPMSKQTCEPNKNTPILIPHIQNTLETLTMQCVHPFCGFMFVVLHAFS